MSETGGTNAAATLSLQINTQPAHQSLGILEKRIELLATRSQGSVQAPAGITAITTGAKQAERSIANLAQVVQNTKFKFTPFSAGSGDILAGFKANLSKELDEVKASLESKIKVMEGTMRIQAAKLASSAAAVTEKAGSSGGMTDNMKIMLRSAEMTGAAAIKAGETQIKNLDKLKAAQAAIYSELLRGDEQRGKAQARLRDLNATGTNASERAKVLAAEKQITEQMAAQAAARELNVTGARAAERAKVLAEERRITQELKEQAQWAAMTNKERATATLKAARALYTIPTSGPASTGPERVSRLEGAAGSAPALKAAQSAGSITAADAAYKSLTASTTASSNAQIHWNKVANEGHAAARGLAGGLGALWLTYGSLAPLLAGAVIAGSIKQMISVGKELEFQFTMISAISEGATVDVKKFNDAVSGTMFTPTEAATGLRVLAQAGLGVSDALTALPPVLKLATVGETDMATAALSATSIMHAFGLSVSDMGHIGDVFAKAAAISATSVTAMMEAMKQASSVSDMFGVSMEETAAALATLANRGIEGSAAGTAIRNMVKELASPATDKAAAAMKQFGIEVFNADGSSKGLMQNLEQLAQATSTMTDKSRTNFLEVLFNERGVKAANILLTDMQKMNEALEDLKMSSEGLGFMTEAQIKLSQTTEGMLKSMSSGFQQTLSEVFTGVAPQIKEIVSSLSQLAGSEEFKTFLTGIAESVVGLTKVVLDNIDVIKLMGTAYLALKGTDIAVAGFKALSLAITEVTAGMKVLAAVDLAATGATMAKAAAEGTALTTSMAAVATTGTRAGTVIANLATGAMAMLLNPIGLTIAGLASVAAGFIYLYDKLTSTTSAYESGKKALDGYASSHDAMVRGIDAGINALNREIETIDAQIVALREGKSAADAYANAKARGPAIEAQANLASAREVLAAAEQKLAAGPADRTKGLLGQLLDKKQLENDVADATAKVKQLERTTDSIVGGTVIAVTRANELAMKKEVAAHITNVQNVNAQVKKAISDGQVAAAALASGSYKQGIDASAVKATEDRLKKQVALGDRSKGLADKPLSESSSAADVELRKTQLESLKDNTYQRPLGRTKTGSAAAKPNKDFRKIAEDNLASAIKQEQIKLGMELLDVEIELAGQTISSVVATEKKNAATKESLIAEQALIEASLAAAKLSKDEVLIAKFQNDLDENTVKLKKQEKAAILDVTKLITADNTAVKDLSISTARYIEDLKIEREALDLTAQEVVKLRIERERDRALEDLKLRSDRNLVTPEQEAAERAAIAARAAAKQEDADYQESYVAGWKKAYKEYADAATSESKRAADTFATLTGAMESALDQFLTTGKLNFADFAKSVILNLAKIEAKALIAKAAGAMGGSGGFGGIVGSILGMFGGSSFGTSGTTNSFMTNGVALGTPWAKGGVFSDSPSLHAYANTVQTSPKTFAYANVHKFAKGGVFAEAGPEAVMPLARDSAGRLGVKSQGGNGGRPISIVVNVNGNSNAPDVRRAAGQGAREALAAFNGARKYG